MIIMFSGLMDVIMAAV